MTDEEILDNDQNRTRPNESIDNESLALRSCYGSLTELNISVTEKLQTKKPVEQILNSNHSQIVPVRQQSNIDVDEQGWRFVKNLNYFYKLNQNQFSLR